MSRILEIQKRSNEWLASFDDKVIQIIESNEGSMLNMNRSNMLESKDANDGPLIHKLTGSARLSKAYAKRTGKTYPNLFLTGSFQSGMIFTMPTIKDYIITSDNEKVNILQANYGKIFGVSPTHQPEAKQTNNSAIINDYMRTVFQ